MIKINRNIIDYNFFPDGTPALMNVPVIKGAEVEIEWLYDKGEEFVFYAVCIHYAEQGKQVVLSIPYIPNARMDRIKESNEVNTIHTFSKMLSSIPNICRVVIWDPHSFETVKQLEENVCENIDIRTGYRGLFASIVKTVHNKHIDYICFPDAGAAKKYLSLFPLYERNGCGTQRLSATKIIFGEKVRDWKTGEILGLKICDKDGSELTPEQVKKEGISSVLIVDDICSYGGTIYYCSNKLHELGVEKIYAHITHTEDSIFEGHLLKSDESKLDGYITTDDILHIDKMTVEHNVPFCVSISFRTSTDEKNQIIKELE